MPYKLSGQEVIMILSAIYEKHGFIADQLYDPSATFPIHVLNGWKRAELVGKEITPEFFAYQNRQGQKRSFNLFLFGRLHLAIDKGGNSFEELYETAIFAPLLKPDTFAIRVAEMNLKDYLLAFGGSDLLRHHYPILEMLLAYHRHDFHPVDRYGNICIQKTVNSYDGFAREMYHRIGGTYDWQAIAHFIIQDTKHQGEGAMIMSKYGNVQVYKNPLNTACGACRALFLDNGKPRLFYIAELLQNGAGKIRQRIEGIEVLAPTCGPSHLWCNCSGPYLFTRYEHWWTEEPADKHLPLKNFPKPECGKVADHGIRAVIKTLRGFFRD